MATIMIVDDAAFTRSKFRRLLTQHGYQVVEAANGSEAVAKYKEAKVDAVLLDINMPDIDGVQVLKELVKLDPSVKVAMCTAMSYQSMIMECLKAGARSFVAKPFDDDQLLSELNRILA